MDNGARPLCKMCALTANPSLFKRPCHPSFTAPHTGEMVCRLARTVLTTRARDRFGGSTQQHAAGRRIGGGDISWRRRSPPARRARAPVCTKEVNASVD